MFNLSRDCATTYSLRRHKEMSENTVASKAAWVKAKNHPVTLPSGTTVEMIVPNLPHLIKAGEIPNQLVEDALGAAARTTNVTRQQIEQQAEFYNKLVAIAVTKPSVAETDVPELPFEDVEMIVEIATRQRDLDAVGKHIGGLHTVDEFRKFRGLDSSDSLLEDL